MHKAGSNGRLVTTFRPSTLLVSNQLTGVLSHHTCTKLVPMDIQ